jgi:hypothetical protein
VPKAVRLVLDREITPRPTNPQSALIQSVLEHRKQSQPSQAGKKEKKVEVVARPVLIDGKLPGVSVYERNMKRVTEKVRWVEDQLEAKELQIESECTFKPAIIATSG